ncbi:MAG: glutamate--tRNA ligase [Anaerolineales bacterium]|nr:glutamate--tRNA ligase [Anaerolineales bacterium]
MTESIPVRVRFAPSPTGRFHIGGARTALYNYLLARQTGGQFILRIEDTDRKRFDPAAEQEYMESLRWLGIEWDEGPDVGGPCAPYRQSERTKIYQQHAEQLVQRGSAYYCFCSPDRLAQMREEQQARKEPPHYDGLCRRLSVAEAKARVDSGETYVIRFKTPRDGVTNAVDTIRGEITFENETIDDYILLKSNGLPVYHLAAMVDDHLMEITHVFRGLEWLPTFPLHVLIYQAFEWKQPHWVHLSVFLNPSGKGKMSKRQVGNKEIYVFELRDAGYIPEGLNNWIALMGWSYDDHTEFFTMQDLIDKFSIEKLSPSSAAVNYGKLDHFNGLHIRALPTSELSKRIHPLFEAAGYKIDEKRLDQITPIIQERIHTLDEAVDLAGFFFQETIDPTPIELVGKNMTAQESTQAAKAAYEVIEAQTSLEIESLESALRSLADSLGLKAGQLFGILRIAVTGQRVSPPLIESMVIVGKETVLNRIEVAIRLLEDQE